MFEFQIYRQDQVSQVPTLHVLHCYEKLISIHVSLRGFLISFFSLFVLSHLYEVDQILMLELLHNFYLK